MSPLYAPTRYQQGDIAQSDPRDHGFLIETFDPAQASAVITMTSGLQYFMKAWVPRTITATNLWFYASIAAVTPIAGANNVGIYDSAGNRLCASVDQTTAYTAAAGMRTIAFSTPTSIPGGPGVFVWLAMKCSATTTMSLSRLAQPNAAVIPNANLIAALSRAATNGTSTVALLPATITPASNTQSTSTFWMAVT